MVNVMIKIRLPSVINNMKAMSRVKERINNENNLN